MLICPFNIHNSDSYTIVKSTSKSTQILQLHTIRKEFLLSKNYISNDKAWSIHHTFKN